MDISRGSCCRAMEPTRPLLRRFGTTADVVTTSMFLARFCRSKVARVQLESCARDDTDGNMLLETMRAMSSGTDRVDFGPLKSGLFPDMGRGMYTTSILFPGQRICSISTKNLITVESAMKQIDRMMMSTGDGLLEWNDAPDPWAVLALYVSMLSSDKGEKTAYQLQYSSLLPKALDTVLQWDQEDLSMLYGSYLYVIGREIWESTDNTIANILSMNLGSFSTINETNLRWSISILLSRLVRLENTAGTSILALCPGMDFLNMSCASSAFISADEEHSIAFLKSDRFYTPGDQIFINYGEKTSGELYISYGFYPEENPHDACLYLLQPDSDNISLTKEMQEHDIPTKKHFPLRREGLPEGILRYAAVASLDTDETMQASKLYYSTKADKDISSEHRKRALGWLSKNIRHTMSTYSMSQKECKRILQDVSTTQRHKIIAQIMLQEHRILNKTLFAVNNMRRQL